MSVTPVDEIFVSNQLVIVSRFAMLSKFVMLTGCMNLGQVLFNVIASVSLLSYVHLGNCIICTNQFAILPFNFHFVFSLSTNIWWYFLCYEIYSRLHITKFFFSKNFNCWLFLFVKVWLAKWLHLFEIHSFREKNMQNLWSHIYDSRPNVFDLISFSNFRWLLKVLWWPLVSDSKPTTLQTQSSEYLYFLNRE